MTQYGKTAIVAGIGPCLGSALCLQLAGAGYRVAGFARSESASRALLDTLGAERFMPVGCDITDVARVDEAVSEVENRLGPPAVYIHNAARFHMQPFVETDPSEFESIWRTTTLGAVHCAQRVLPAMLEAGSGTLLFVGATASIKAAAHFAAFGAAKFALRGLAQSLARELGPQGIHVAHLLIDGVMWSDRARDLRGMTEDQCLDPKAVAQACLSLIEQDRSAWTHELDIRPDRERF